MSYNYTIIIDKGDCNDDFVSHLFRALLSGTNLTLNFLIEVKKYDWETVSEVLASELIRNATDKYNNMVAR